VAWYIQSRQLGCRMRRARSSCPCGFSLHAGFLQHSLQPALLGFGGSGPLNSCITALDGLLFPPAEAAAFSATRRGTCASCMPAAGGSWLGKQRNATASARAPAVQQKAGKKVAGIENLCPRGFGQGPQDLSWLPVVRCGVVWHDLPAAGPGALPLLAAPAVPAKRFAKAQQPQQ